MRQLPSRPRLESRLDGALAHRLTLLVADAGFGKTTLLASWSAGVHAVVYPVAAGDQDLTRLWRGLVGVLRPHLPGPPEAWASSARGPVSAHSESVRPQAMAELLGQALQQRLTRDLVLVLDDAHLVATGPAASFVAGLVRHAPPLLHIVLAARGPVPVPAVRLRAQGQVLEVSGAELAFTTGEAATLLAEVAGADTRGLAEELRSATGGWPIAVRLAVEALREVPPAQRAGRLARLAAPEGQLADLIGAIHGQEPGPTRQLLAIGALFGRFTVDFAAALGVPDAATMVAGLVRRGLFVEPVPDARTGGPVPDARTGDQAAREPAALAARGATGPWYRLHPLARQFLTEQAPLPAAEAARLREAAVRWFADNGMADAALRWLLAAGHQPDRVAALLASTGEQLAASGHADVVVEAVGSLPVSQRDAGMELLAGHAYLVRGDWDDALACYQRAAGDQDRLPAGLAWRIGMVHYLRGEHDRALATYQRAEESGAATRDTALLLAWSATVHWIRGEAKTCGELAARALGIATDVDDPTALAAAHTILSMLSAMEGDRRANAAHYTRALEYARRAGDILQLIRIHANRASHNLEEGDYPPAMAELDVAVRLADLHGYGAFGGVALTNRAEIRIRLGQLEEAHHDTDAAVAIFDDLGSHTVAYPLRLRGQLHHLRGETGAAVRAYDRALVHVAASGDQQAQVPALAGLARVLIGDEPDRAGALVEQALAAGEGLGYVDALLTAARLAAAGGDAAPTGDAASGAAGGGAAGGGEAARRYAQAARASAEARRDRAGIAEAYEIEASVTADPARAQAIARQAVAAWAEINDPIGQSRAELVLASWLDDAEARSTIARAVRERMGTIGCRAVAAWADALVQQTGPAAEQVRVETLGAFRVIRDGAALPATGWSSRKARDILKILVARRGRPVTREFLMEALWPGQPPAVLANRLHVAVSMVRATLDPDRRQASDTFVVTDDDTVRVRLERVAVDVELFLADAAGGLALLRAGRVAAALPRLTRAESRYAGNFLEEDLYEDWAVPLREQARTTYLAVAAQLAQQAEQAGDVDAAARYLLRLLEHDPYDERAHLRLVSTLAATGRHGDARRHYRHYCARMDELEVEAAPFPAPSAPR